VEAETTASAAVVLAPAERPRDRKERISMNEEKKVTTEKPLDKMTVTELREIAKEIAGITGVHGMKKSELLAAIKTARGIVDEPHKKSGAPGPKIAASTAQLKAMIRELKASRRQALEARDKKMAGRYRRQISKLKKKTRQAA
jgi:Rho termination factor, N-terminal domain